MNINVFMVWLKEGHPSVHLQGVAFWNPLGRHPCSILAPFSQQYALPRHKLRSPARQEVVGAVEKRGAKGGWEILQKKM